jgi:hypothetical protein
VSVSPTQDRLEDQINWYDRKSGSNQRWFKGLKVAQIIVGGLIAFCATFRHGLLNYLPGLLGVVVVVLEGLQGLYQFQHNWINYRGTSEQLKREKYLWLAKAGPYASADHPDVLLAERIEDLISREQTSWVALKEQVSPGTQDQSPPAPQNQTSAAPQDQPPDKSAS